MNIDIFITKVRFGYWEYSTIYKGLFVSKLYDTNNKRINKKDFRQYVQMYTQFN